MNRVFGSHRQKEFCKNPWNFIKLNTQQSIYFGSLSKTCWFKVFYMPYTTWPFPTFTDFYLIRRMLFSCVPVFKLVQVWSSVGLEMEVADFCQAKSFTVCMQRQKTPRLIPTVSMITLYLLECVWESFYSVWHVLFLIKSDGDC